MKDKRKTLGVGSRCRECEKTRAIQWTLDNPEARYRIIRKSWYKRVYGVDIAWYDAKLEEQDGRCGICRGSVNGILHIDHNHDTGEPRGLLCDLCNKGLGMFRDDLSRVESAFTYLANYEMPRK